MKNAVITSVDYHYGDFLINHWLRSFKANVELDNIDIVFFDFGLTPLQCEALNKESVIIVTCKQTGHIVNTRFIELTYFLEKNKYDQVLFADGGDIIFQGDISLLFNQDRDIFRAIKLDLEVLFYEVFIPRNFDKQDGEKIYEYLKNKPVLNAGFILGPSYKFISMCKNMNEAIKNRNAYGPDQVALNYFIYKERVKLLDRTYNFMITTAYENFNIKNGTFYFNNGEKIVVVHNAGHNSFLRPIKNFGYGKNFNTLNSFVYHLRRSFFKLVGIVKRKQRYLRNIRL